MYHLVASTVTLGLLIQVRIREVFELLLTVDPPRHEIATWQLNTEKYPRYLTALQAETLYAGGFSIAIC